MPSSKQLTAVVIGAGWAGEGHVKALQYCGVEVLALCSRTLSHVEAVAANLNVPRASTDWRASLLQLKPDIVTIATPANLRGEVVEVAAQLGCHLVCEKPLAATAEEAQRMYSLVKRINIKHAYAATHRYDPGVIWLSELFNNHKIGILRHIDFIFIAPTSPFTPWDVTSDTLAYGGGILNMGFTHILSMLERITQRKATAVAGAAFTYRVKAPVIPENLHDKREGFKRQLAAEQAEQMEWRSRDADDSFTLLLQMASVPPESAAPITVFVLNDVFAPNVDPQNGWRFYGSEGTLIGEGLFTLSLSQQTGTRTEPIAIPEKVLNSLPKIGDEVDNRWGALFRDFVADIQGEPHEPYLTFQDGWRYQEIIDSVRQRKGWFQVPLSP